MRVTKRYPPAGYICVDLPLAKVLYCHGISVTMYGNNVNESHVFDGWQCSCTMDPFSYQNEEHIVDGKWVAKTDSEVFDDFVNSFVSYLDPELGKYPVFCVYHFDYKCWKTFKEVYDKVMRQNRRRKVWTFTVISSPEVVENA